MKKYLTLLKRECWENRFSFFIAPIILAGFTVLLAVFVDINYDNGQIKFELPMKDSTSVNINKGGLEIYSYSEPIEETGDSEVVYRELSHAEAVNQALFISTFLFSLFMIIVFVSYSLTCLQDERKGNSLLFWNSFPVSHTEAVLVKLITASALTPVITLLAIIITQVLIMAVAWLRLMGTDAFEHLIWPNLHLMDAWLAYTVNILVFALGSLSAIGLLLTISATGYRAFILLSLTLLGLAVVTFLITGDGMTAIRFLFIEPMLASTSLFDSNRFPVTNGEAPISLFFTLARQAIETLQSYSFWFAILIGIGMVIAAINMRKYRSEV
jgi:hypothetical protein